MEDFKKVSDLLYVPGEIMPGVEMTLEEACTRGMSASFCDGAPFCVVSDWIWIDLIVPDALRETLVASGQQPAMVYASRVLYDSARRFEAGDWVRTTQLVEFTDECIFKTRNTRYVLSGPGVRKSAELCTVLKIF
ncbi:hypothetical protein JQR85_13995 [Stutzerimonas urumqiensis]|uniref:DUF6957 family protein n=1 Tax=Stutzerimonas urumqiensis TaxID=638269 RepID=UPI003DA39172